MSEARLSCADAPAPPSRPALPRRLQGVSPHVDHPWAGPSQLPPGPGQGPRVPGQTYLPHGQHPPEGLRGLPLAQLLWGALLFTAQAGASPRQREWGTPSTGGCCQRSSGAGRSSSSLPRGCLFSRHRVLFSPPVPENILVMEGAAPPRHPSFPTPQSNKLHVKRPSKS